MRLLNCQGMTQISIVQNNKSGVSEMQTSDTIDTYD